MNYVSLFNFHPSSSPEFLYGELDEVSVGLPAGDEGEVAGEGGEHILRLLHRHLVVLAVVAVEGAVTRCKEKTTPFLQVL